MYKHNSKKIFINAICLYAILFILLLTVGYSSLFSTLAVSNISMIFRLQDDIRITNVTTSNVTNDAMSNFEEYNVKNIVSSVTLPNSNSTITYAIEVTNVGNVKEGIYNINEIYKLGGVSVSNNLEIKSMSINLKETLCDDNNSSLCKLGSISTFTITIGYKTNGYNGTDIDYNVELDFDFRRMFDISYSGFNSTSGLPLEMISGDTLNITFTSTNGIPYNTSVTGATGSYTSPTLTLTNVTSDITVTFVANSGVEPGTEVITNSDGSIITITTSDDGTGNVIVTGYDIDTTNVQGGSISVPTGGIDTGVLVFDGHDFDITLEAKFTFANVDQNSTNPVIDMSIAGTDDVDGFLILVANNYGGTSYNESGGTISGGSSNRYIKWRMNKYVDGTPESDSRDYYYNGGTTPFYSNRFATQSTTITVTIKVFCRSGVFTSEMYYNNNLIAKPRYSSANNPYTMTFSAPVGEATVKLGVWTNKSGTTYTSNFDIIDFNVTKIIN